MALKVNKNVVIKPITTEITAFIGNIDLIEENMAFAKNTQYILTLDYDYNFILFIHHLSPVSAPSYGKIGSQFLSIDTLKEDSSKFITLSGVTADAAGYGYKVSSDSTGRIITIKNQNYDVISSLTILGILNQKKP